MGKRPSIRLATFLILGLVFTVSCATIKPVSVKPLQATLGLTPSEKPLIKAGLGKVRVVPFAKDVTPEVLDGWNIFRGYHSYLKKNVEGPFNNVFRTFLGTPGLFGGSEKDVINVQAELLSLRDHFPAATIAVTMFYEFRSEDGTLLLAKKVTSQATKSGLSFWIGIANASNEALSNTIIKLGRLIRKKLPTAWQVYAKKRETERRLRQQIAAGLKRENRYFRVSASNAVLREMPDAEARQVARLPQADLVHVTGSLPSGWLQVSREGKPLGWVHASLLREDFASAPSYRPEEPPMVPAPAAPLPAAPASVDVASLDFGSYHALLVGNNDYRSLPNLRTAVNDARAMAGLLQEKYGFSVRLLTNATRADILRAISGYRRTLTRRDNLLIYYAGHGWLDKDADEGYWLPVDATEEDSTHWISNSSITSALRAMQAKHVLVIADSCYSGKLARGIKIKTRTSNYYERICRKKARTVMASGGLEPVADEGGKGRHSVFASALIEALNENQGVLDTTLLFIKIRRPVMVNADQTPEYSDIRKAGHDGGDFLFVRRK
jgi:hypothetical protein